MGYKKLLCSEMVPDCNGQCRVGDRNTIRYIACLIWNSEKDRKNQGRASMVNKMARKTVLAINLGTGKFLFR